MVSFVLFVFYWKKSTKSFDQTFLSYPLTFPFVALQKNEFEIQIKIEFNKIP
jgi:hypothetical protein